MSTAPDRTTIQISNINICLGGVQIVNMYSGHSTPKVIVTKQPSSRFELFNNGIIATGSDGPTGSHWFVVGADSQGVGTLCHLSVTYPQGYVDSEHKVRARVYQGATSSTTDPGYDPNLTVDGIRENDGLKWTWTAADANHRLTGAAYSQSGEPNYCVFWITDLAGNNPEFDSPIRAFHGIPSPYASGSCGGNYLESELAAAKELEILIRDGKLSGDYVLHQVGPLLWRILTGRLSGCIDFTGHGNWLTVRTPFGERIFPVPQERPFGMVLPGDLFGSKHDVVVTAP
jgi:hypothetical protein